MCWKYYSTVKCSKSFRFRLSMQHRRMKNIRRKWAANEQTLKILSDFSCDEPGLVYIFIYLYTYIEYTHKYNLALNVSWKWFSDRTPDTEMCSCDVLHTRHVLTLLFRITCFVCFAKSAEVNRPPPTLWQDIRLNGQNFPKWTENRRTGHSVPPVPCPIHQVLLGNCCLVCWTWHPRQVIWSGGRRMGTWHVGSGWVSVVGN